MRTAQALSLSRASRARLRVAGGREGGPPREELVEEDADGPDVHLARRSVLARSRLALRVRTHVLAWALAYQCLGWIQRRQLWFSSSLSYVVRTDRGVVRLALDHLRREVVPGAAEGVARSAIGELGAPPEVGKLRDVLHSTRTGAVRIYMCAHTHTRARYT